jgi:hypothetical protein
MQRARTEELDFAGHCLGVILSDLSTTTCCWTSARNWDDVARETKGYSSGLNDRMHVHQAKRCATEQLVDHDRESIKSQSQIG